MHVQRDQVLGIVQTLERDHRKHYIGLIPGTIASRTLIYLIDTSSIILKPLGVLLEEEEDYLARKG